MTARILITEDGEAYEFWVRDLRIEIAGPMTSQDSVLSVAGYLANAPDRNLVVTPEGTELGTYREDENWVPQT